mmetsp:Transcript_69352/g.224213  ORF Transcript_69352/g.224213 Transcript_69352/m.224213 type:complete len:326 (+) Transcript_69352:834-1811(+)
MTGRSFSAHSEESTMPIRILVLPALASALCPCRHRTTTPWHYRGERVGTAGTMQRTQNWTMRISLLRWRTDCPASPVQTPRISKPLETASEAGLSRRLLRPTHAFRAAPFPGRVAHCHSLCPRSRELVPRLWTLSGASPQFQAAKIWSIALRQQAAERQLHLDSAGSPRAARTCGFLTRRASSSAPGWQGTTRASAPCQRCTSMKGAAEASCSRADQSPAVALLRAVAASSQVLARASAAATDVRGLALRRGQEPVIEAVFFSAPPRVAKGLKRSPEHCLRSSAGPVHVRRVFMAAPRRCQVASSGTSVAQISTRGHFKPLHRSV